MWRLVLQQIRTVAAAAEFEIFFLSPPLLPSFLPSVVLYPRKKNWLRRVLQYIRDNILLLHSKCWVIIITTSTTVLVSSSHLSSSSGCRVTTTKTRTITLYRFLIPSGTKKKISFLKRQSPFCLWARFEQDFILARRAPVSENSEREREREREREKSNHKFPSSSSICWGIEPQFFTKFVCKWQHCKDVNTRTRLNTHSILICDLRMTRVCFATNATFENCSSLMCHQVKWSSHLVGSMDNLLNKDHFSMTNACEDSSIDVSTPNMLMSFSSCSLGLWILHYWTRRFSWWKQIIRSGMTIFTSYLEERWMYSYYPHNFL